MMQDFFDELNGNTHTKEFGLWINRINTNEIQEILKSYESAYIGKGIIHQAEKDNKHIYTPLNKLHLEEFEWELIAKYKNEYRK